MADDRTDKLLRKSYQEIQQLRAALREARSTAAEPIAIIGMACRAPGGVVDPEGFWALLEAGRDGVGPLPSRWNHERIYDPDRDASGKSYVREGGFLTDAERFDAARAGEQLLAIYAGFGLRGTAVSGEHAVDAPTRIGGEGGADDVPTGGVVLQGEADTGELRVSDADTGQVRLPEPDTGELRLPPEPTPVVPGALLHDGDGDGVDTGPVLQAAPPEVFDEPLAPPVPVELPLPTGAEPTPRVPGRLWSSTSGKPASTKASNAAAFTGVSSLGP